MKIKSLIRLWVIPILIALILSSIINRYYFRVIVPSNSMYPMLPKGSHLIAKVVHNKNEIKRGDIIVFHSEEMKANLIKRVIGLPGDKIIIDENGIVYINGNIYKEKYIKNNSKGKCYNFNVPDNCFLFLGDNRTNSYDSRYWRKKYIDFKDIKGKFLFKSL